MRAEPSGLIPNCCLKPLRMAKFGPLRSKYTRIYSEPRSAITRLARSISIPPRTSSGATIWPTPNSSPARVTPHDPSVLRLVSSARNYVPRGRLAGYELPGNSPTAVAAQVNDEARGVFAALKHRGLSYVDSISTFGNFTGQAERVRLPSETLSMNGANCIDMSVAFALAMEIWAWSP